MAVLLIGVSILGPGKAPAQETTASHPFEGCANPSVKRYEPGPIRSLYVTMRDGVRIAIDVVLPAGLAEGTRVPTVLNVTRYWRAYENEGPKGFQRLFAAHGYAVVTADSRGTGASFGTWPYHRSPAEVDDFPELVDWVVAQPWSDGRVGGWGVSYGANTADWLARSGHPNVHALIPRFPDFDPYNDLYLPGGVLHYAFGQNWGARVKSLDLNTPRGNPPRRVRPVDGDSGMALLRRAVADRAHMPSVYEGFVAVTFRDDRPDVWNASMEDWSIHLQRGPIERAERPFQVWASWLDGGTASGALHRFMTWSNPQRVIIGGWSHGARYDADPFLPSDAPLDPARELLDREDICFFDRHLKQMRNGISERSVTYYTLGERRWRTTTVWPPAGSVRQSWYFHEDGVLSTDAPTAIAGEDSYVVDYGATTGTANRWRTQDGGPDVVYPDRAAADQRLLTYTSAPITRDLEITGEAVATLFVTSTATDGAFFVYLEDVDPAGRVTYITEGVLRAIHRKISADAPYRSTAPYHSFRRSDALPLVPGAIADLRIGLRPTSVLIRRGHRLRVAIAGADDDTFVRIPETGTPTISVMRRQGHASFIRLPIIPR